MQENLASEVGDFSGMSKRGFPLGIVLPEVLRDIALLGKNNPEGCMGNLFLFLLRISGRLQLEEHSLSSLGPASNLSCDLRLLGLSRGIFLFCF